MRKEPTWNYNSLLWFKSQGKTGQAHKIMNTATNLEKLPCWTRIILLYIKNIFLKNAQIGWGVYFSFENICY